MAYKASDLIITLVLVGTVLAMLSLSILGSVATYNIATNDTFFNDTAANLLVETEGLASNISGYTQNMSTSSSALDYFGGLIGSGWQAIKLTASSAFLMTGLVDMTLTNGGSLLGPSAQYLKTAFYTIIIVIIFVAILLRMILKEQT